MIAGPSYEEWELIENLPTAEPVRDAIDYELNEWPWPISGDLIARGRRRDCPTCHGDGWHRPDLTAERCPTCNPDTREVCECVAGIACCECE